jgi:hypothetical protein
MMLFSTELLLPQQSVSKSKELIYPIGKCYGHNAEIEACSTFIGQY